MDPRDRVLQEFLESTKAAMTFEQLRTSCREAARAALGGFEGGSYCFVASMTREDVVIGVEFMDGTVRLLQMPYSVDQGVVALDTTAAVEVAQTYAPITEFDKSLTRGEGNRAVSDSFVGVKAADGSRRIKGWASVFDVADRDGETMKPGAFKSGLATFMASPQMLYNHGRDPKIGRSVVGKWTVVQEKSYGLWVEGELAVNDENADYLWNLVDQGMLSALSVGGHYQARGKDIVRWDLFEISLAVVPSNAFATIAVVKNAPLVPSVVSDAELLLAALGERHVPELELAYGAVKTAFDAGDTPPLEELTPAMALGRKALNAQEERMDQKDIDALAAALAGTTAVAVKTVLDGVEEARVLREAEATAAAAAKTARDAELLEAATAAATKAVEDYKEELRKAGFKGIVGIPLPNGQKSDDPGEPDHRWIEASYKYDNMDFADLAWLQGARQAAHGYLKPNTLYVPDQTLVKVAAVKAAELYAGGVDLAGKSFPKSAGRYTWSEWVNDPTGKTAGNPGKQMMLAPWAEKVDELMESDLASYGLEWIPTLWSSQIWERVRGENQVVAFLAAGGMVVEMPSDPWTIPLDAADPAVKRAPQATAEADFRFAGPAGISRVTTANRTMTTGKMMVIIPFTAELAEDSIVPIVPQLRSQTELAMNDGVESVVINGDQTAGASSNINAIDTTPAATDPYLIADGLRHLALITTTSDAMSIGTITTGKYRQLRSLMGTRGRLGLRTADLMTVVDSLTYYQMLGLDETITVDKFGPNATLKTGGLESLDNIRIHASEQLALSQAADGKIDANTAGNNTKGTILIFNRRQFRLGYRRRMQMEVDRVPFADGAYLVSSLRMAFQARDTEGVAVGYGVDV